MTHDYTLEHCDAYALGTLSDEDRNRVDAHLGSCSSCSRAVGQAESVVCAMIEMTTPLCAAPRSLEKRINSIVAQPPARAAIWKRSSFTWAVAAAVTLSLGVSTADLWRQTVALQTMNLRNDAVLATIATSHFKHVNLVARLPGVPAAKVLYAPDRSWMYLVIDSSSCDCHMVAQYGDDVRDLGAPQTNDLTSTLFVKNNGKPNSVRLVSSSGAVLAEADLK